MTLTRPIRWRRFQGPQRASVGCDELTQWATLYAYRYLRGRLRSAHDVPTKRMRSAGSPGGPGHLEVKSYFIDPAPGGFAPIDGEAEGMTRMFIPSKLRDNRLLQKFDPTYEARLRALGGSLARAMSEPYPEHGEHVQEPGWIAAGVVLATALAGMIGNSVHVGAQTAENTRQIRCSGIA